MPLTSKGTKIRSAMESEYGKKKGESVFYASKNAGKITGVDKMRTKDVGQLIPPISREEENAEMMATGDARAIVARLAGRFAADQAIRRASRLLAVRDARMPSKDAFRKAVRDGVMAGEPLPQVLDAGTTWGTGPMEDKTFEPTKDQRRKFKDALRAGKSIRMALKDADMGDLDMGNTSGSGVPMSNVDDEMPGEDQRHFFKGSLDRKRATKDYGVKGMRHKGRRAAIMRRKKVA